MGINYKRLWKLLIDKNMTKTELRKQSEIASSTLSKMSRNKYVSLEYIDNYKKRYKETMKQYLKTNDISILKDFINNYENNYPIN